jgi:predicted dehydrogenase
MPAEVLGYGIVGCGWVAPAHAAAVSLAPGARLLATVDHKRAAAERLAERFGGSACDTYKELLARRDIDIVSICLPQHVHCAATLQALEAGKHVLCEKPMALSVAECDAMIEGAVRAQRQLGVVFNFRYAATARTVLDLVRDGAIGRVSSLVASVSMRATAAYPPRVAWRESRSTTTGGILTHRVIHLLDFLVLLLGEPHAVAATLVDDQSGLEEAAAVSFRFAHDVVATLSATISAQQLGTRIDIHGTGGSVVMTDRTVEFNGCSVPLLDDIAVPPELADCLIFGTGHVWAMRDFVEAVRSGTPAPVGGADGRRMQQLMEDLYRNAKR